MQLICTLMLFILLAGCEKTAETEDHVLATDPSAEMVELPSEFASMAIDRTGGLSAWGKVRDFQLGCIVTFYDQDAGYYLTEQIYDIFPWSNSIVISGTESRESYKWQLSQGKFDILEGVGQLGSFKGRIQSNCLAEAILNLLTAPVRFVDKSFVYTRSETEVNLQGRWCYPVTREQATESASDVSGNNTVFYQNRADSLVDMILLKCAGDETCLLVSGYDYKEIEDMDISIPTRIEIHLANNEGVAERQLFRINISSVK
jgi:hypothetical protein